MSQSDFVNRGQALVAAGQYQEAVKVCRLGLLGRPTTVEGRIVLGQALLALKRYDEVLAEMRVALELDHASVSAQVLKGDALLRKGDHNGAIEVLHRARMAAPADARLGELLSAAERASGKPQLGASHPSVGFLGNDTESPTMESTKHYPSRSADEEDTGDDDKDVEYTRPTSLAVPSAKRRSNEQAMRPEPTPAALRDKSGTVEVDPDLDGVEVRGESDDFGEIAAPPPSKQMPLPVLPASPRGRAKPASKMLPAPSRPARGKRGDVSSVELDDDELMELNETMEAQEATVQRPPGRGTAVRNAVMMPSGPIDLPPAAVQRPTGQRPGPSPATPCLC